MNNSDFYSRLDNSKKVLVGIGAGFSKNCDKDAVIEYYNKLSLLLSGKDYFIVNISNETFIKESEIDMSRVALPLDQEVSEEVGEAQWNEYTKWLQLTLNRDLLVLELGVGFDMPTLVRWPFEKIAMLNNKAYLYRVNENFPQLPDDINQKGVGIKMAVREYLDSIFEERYGN